LLQLTSHFKSIKEDLGSMKIGVLDLKKEAVEDCSSSRPLDGQSQHFLLDGQKNIMAILFFHM